MNTPHILRQTAVGMLLCLNSENQTLYQALVNKADSYPEDKIFHILAFNKAATDVAAYENNLYLELAETHRTSIPFYGPAVQQFIYDHIQLHLTDKTTPYQRYSLKQRDEYRERRTRRALAHCKAQVEMVALRQPILH